VQAIDDFVEPAAAVAGGIIENQGFTAYRTIQPTMARSLLDMNADVV
jgi:hypothetical protein